MRSARAITILHSIVALATTAPSLALAADVYDTTATLQWTTAAGPVASYAVFVDRNSQGYPTAPDQIVVGTQVTIQAAFGDRVLVRVAARDALGNQGPYSVPSEPIQFIQPVPVMQLDKTSLSATAPQGTSPSDGLFSITNAGQSRLDYTIASSAGWLSTLPASGSAALGRSGSIGSGGHQVPDNALNPLVPRASAPDSLKRPGHDGSGHGRLISELSGASLEAPRARCARLPRPSLPGGSGLRPRW